MSTSAISGVSLDGCFSLRVPCECLSQIFRKTQKRVNKELTLATKTVEALPDRFSEAAAARGHSVPVSSTHSSVTTSSETSSSSASTLSVASGAATASQRGENEGVVPPPPGGAAVKEPSPIQQSRREIEELMISLRRLREAVVEADEEERRNLHRFSTRLASLKDETQAACAAAEDTSCPGVTSASAPAAKRSLKLRDFPQLEEAMEVEEEAEENDEDDDGNLPRQQQQQQQRQRQQGRATTTLGGFAHRGRSFSGGGYYSNGVGRYRGRTSTGFANGAGFARSGSWTGVGSSTSSSTTTSSNSNSNSNGAASGSRKRKSMSSRWKGSLSRLRGERAPPPSPNWIQRRLDVWMGHYLLRRSAARGGGQAFIDTAKKLTEEAGLQDMLDIEVFERALGIEQALLHCDCGPALEWCSDNGSKLRRLDSSNSNEGGGSAAVGATAGGGGAAGGSLELKLRKRVFLELVRDKRKEEAMRYAQEYLSPHAAAHPLEVQQAMATLVFADPELCSLPDYRALFAEERWAELAGCFRVEQERVLGLPRCPVLEVVLQSGLSALKTPQCYSDSCDMPGQTTNPRASSKVSKALTAADLASVEASAAVDENRTSVGCTLTTESSGTGDAQGMTAAAAAVTDQGRGEGSLPHSLPSQCPVCSDAGRMLAENLPFSYRAQSNLICRITEREMASFEPPLALPNGRVYSAQALRDLAEAHGGKVTCPLTQETFSFDELRNVYII